MLVSQIIQRTNGSTTATITNVTFGDVWYCSGQSNMELPLLHTFHRNQSVKDILAGKYSNIRVYLGNAKKKINFTWMTTSQAIMDGNETIPTYSLFTFSAACYYFAESLTDLIEKAGEKAPPFGQK